MNIEITGFILLVLLPDEWLRCLYHRIIDIAVVFKYVPYTGLFRWPGFIFFIQQGLRLRHAVFLPYFCRYQ